MAKYTRESKRIFEIFRRFTPLVEGLSLDEAFLDLTGTERLLGAPRALAERLRAEVRAETRPRLLGRDRAREAGGEDRERRRQARRPARGARPRRCATFLAPLPVGRIWGVGPVAQARLEAAGFATRRRSRRAPIPRTCAALLGDWGLAAARLARGEDLREVEPWREPVSYSEENTFAEDVADRERARAHAPRPRGGGGAAAAPRRAARAQRRAQAQARAAPLRGAARLPAPDAPRDARRAATDDGGAIAEAARRLLARAGPREPVRLLGVGATNLVPAAVRSSRSSGRPTQRCVGIA